MNIGVIIVMGAGSGRTTAGRALAARLHRPFLDGDDVHSPENVDKRRRGESLTDEDRAPWLAVLRARLETTPGLVLACSALRGAYRDVLRASSALHVAARPEFYVRLDLILDEGGHRRTS